MVSTRLKNISQNGKIGVKIKHIWNHHPEIHCETVKTPWISRRTWEPIWSEKFPGLERAQVSPKRDDVISRRLAWRFRSFHGNLRGKEKFGTDSNCGSPFAVKKKHVSFGHLAFDWKKIGWSNCYVLPIQTTPTCSLRVGKSSFSTETNDNVSVGWWTKSLPI